MKVDEKQLESNTLIPKNGNNPWASGLPRMAGCRSGRAV
jgi:hypothetical protein